MHSADDVFRCDNTSTPAQRNEDDEAIKINGDDQYDVNKEITGALKHKESVEDTEL